MVKPLTWGIVALSPSIGTKENSLLIYKMDRKFRFQVKNQPNCQKNYLELLVCKPLLTFID